MPCTNRKKCYQNGRVSVFILNNSNYFNSFLVDCNKKFVTGKRQKIKVQEPIHIPNVYEYQISPPGKGKKKKKKDVTSNKRV